jgi:N-acetyl-gamma-glutamyl-phosphate reductase
MISKAKAAPTVSRSNSNVARVAAPPTDSPRLTELLDDSPLANSASPVPTTTPALVFGGSGYVAGELLRLLSNHPRFVPAAVFSTTQAGEPVTRAFPHLAGTRLDGVKFVGEEEGAAWFVRPGPLAVFTATPHGAAAPLLAKLFAARAAARENGVDLDERQFHVVDLSADFRFDDPQRWAEIYGQPHGAPELLREFACAVPEHFALSKHGTMPRHAAQPGCFTTAVVCAAWPFFRLGLVEGDVFVAATTGSSGSGKSPSAATHHPDRHATLYSYHPLTHRHEAEMRRLLGAACRGCEPDVEFVPHSGPFVRGIHATIRMTLRDEPVGSDADRAAALVARINTLYGERSFVRATTTPPRLTEVVGTNRCRLGVSVRGRTLVVLSVIDNLTKGAAGGAVQWMNRLFGLDERTGLELAGLGWY